MEQPQHAGDRQHAPPGGVGDVGAEAAGAPRRREVATTSRGRSPAAAGTRRRTAPACRTSCGSRRSTNTTTSDPGDRRAQRALPPAPDRGVGADVGLGVVGPPVARQPGAAAVLQAEDLGVVDAAQLGRPRRAGRAGVGVRGIRPTNARSDDHASPRRAVKRPTNSSVTDSTDELERAQRQAAAARQRGDACACGGGPAAARGGGRAGGRSAPRGGGPGPAGRRRRGPR